MATKQRAKNKETTEGELTLDDRVAPIPQVLDDQTSIDDLEKKKTKANKDQDNLQGFDKRLAAVVEREIRIERDRLSGKNPIILTLTTGKIVSICSEIKIEGDSSIEHKTEKDSCGVRGSVRVHTNSSILIKKTK